MKSIFFKVWSELRFHNSWKYNESKTFQNDPRSARVIRVSRLDTRGHGHQRLILRHTESLIDARHISWHSIPGRLPLRDAKHHSERASRRERRSGETETETESERHRGWGKEQNRCLFIDPLLGTGNGLGSRVPLTPATSAPTLAAWHRESVVWGFSSRAQPG